MTKAERLMYLVNMISNRGKVLVKEMSGACGVSQRTIYRDMNSLSKLNFPLYYDHGYRLARDTGFPYPGLDAEDAELIYYALRNNPLSQHSFFRQRFQVIEQNIKARLRTSPATGTGSFFLFEKRYGLTEKTRETEILALFLRAIHERRKVALTLLKNEGDCHVCVPLAVRLKQFGPHLIVTVDAQRVLEIPVGNIDTIKLSNEKFIQRPMHLLQSAMTMQKNVDEI